MVVATLRVALEQNVHVHQALVTAMFWLTSYEVSHQQAVESTQAYMEDQSLALLESRWLPSYVQELIQWFMEQELM